MSAWSAEKGGRDSGLKPIDWEVFPFIAGHGQEANSQPSFWQLLRGKEQMNFECYSPGALRELAVEACVKDDNDGSTV